ncbi:MAG: phosphoadenosine phosphosulfate reductase family protein [Bryobacteraceae bacterium]
MSDSIQYTIKSLQAYGPQHRHWAMAWSGGKDSTTLVTLVVWLIETGQVPRPETLTVCYADTRLELLPLYVSARSIQGQLAARGIDVRTVMAPMDKRFLVYMLGRGVPPPNNNTFRWCTRQIKIDPMKDELEKLFGERGEKILMLTGVRQGESAIRDNRIAMSCGLNGAECGQGWYQETLPDSLCDTLAPILHWRVCHIWDWLKIMAPMAEYGGWDTTLLADAYGGDEAEEINARTGCVGCPLAQHDTALEAILRIPGWEYLRPLLELRPLWRELREGHNRLRQPAGEKRADGSLCKKQHRMGPLTIEAREMALKIVLDVQARIKADSMLLDRPTIDLLNQDEIDRIMELIAARTFPRRWTGNEPRGDEDFDEHYADGTVQPSLFGG